MLHHRRFLCLLDLSYDACRAFRSIDVVKLSRRLVQELTVIALLAPFMYSDMRSLPSPRLYTTDASNSTYAACSATISASASTELIRYTMKKGKWSRLLSPVQKWLRERNLLELDDELPGCEGASPDGVPLLWEAVVGSLDFRVCATRACRKEHINVSELRSIGLAESIEGSLPEKSRPLIGTDSQVALACVIKGRSASSILNHQLCTMLPNVVGSRLHSRFFWVPSKLNPADDPTRGRPIRRAAFPQPDWLASLSLRNPDYSLIDQFVHDNYPGDDIPRLSDLLKSVEKVEPMPSRHSSIPCASGCSECAPTKSKVSLDTAAVASSKGLGNGNGDAGIRAPCLDSDANATATFDRFVPLIERRRRRRRRMLAHLDNCEVASVKTPSCALPSTFVSGPALRSIPLDKFLLPSGVKRDGVPRSSPLKSEQASSLLW